MTHVIEIARAQLDVIEQAARRAAPLEYCALLLGSSEATTAVITDVLRLRNSDTRAGRFSVDAGELRAAYAVARDRSAEPLALLHSHPLAAPLPSEHDLAALAGSALPWVIVSLARADGVEIGCFAAGSGEAIEVRTVEQ